MFSLSLCTFDAARLHQAHISRAGKYALELVAQLLLHRQHASDVVAEEILSDLNLYLQSIQIIDSVNNKHILRLELLHLEDNALDLRREYVDSTDDEHIVTATYDASHTD